MSPTLYTELSNDPDSLLDYVVQGHRFDVLGQIGCYPVVYNSIPAYFLYFMWPLVFGVISFVYSGKESGYKISMGPN